MTHSRSSEPQATSASRAQEESAERSKTLLRIASRVARLGGWEIDLAHQQVHWSEQSLAILEMSQAVLGLEDMIRFYVPEHRNILRRAIQQCAREGAGFDEELRFITAGGREIWVRTIGEAWRGEAGEIERIHGAIQDISVRKRAERSAAVHVNRFHQFADEMPFIMWTASVDGVIDYANRYFFEYAAIDTQLSPAQHWPSVVHPDDLESTAARWQQSVQTGQPYDVELRVRGAADGAYRWFHVQAALTYNVAGEPRKWYGSAIDIDRTKTFQQQANALAQRLQQTLQSITDGFFTVDENWQVTYVNPVGEQLLERTQGELLGRDLWDAFPAAVSTRFHSQYHHAVAEQQTVCFEEFFAPLNRWFEVTAYPFNGGLAVYFRDITERHQHVERLRLLDTCVANVDDLVMILEVQSSDPLMLKIVYVNETFLKHAGQQADAVIGKPITYLYELEPNYDPLPVIARALASRQAIRDEMASRVDATTEFIVETSYVPVADETGQFTHVALIGRDVTQRRIIEHQLRESEKRFRLLCRVTSDAVWDWEVATGRVQRDEGFEKLCGVPITELTPNLDSWLELIHPEDRDRVVSGLQRVIDEGGSHWVAEYRFMCNDGRVLQVLDRGTVIRDVQGTALRVVGGVTDQTKRKLAEQEIRRLNDELEHRVVQRTAQLAAANKELEAFSYSVSHDLLAPLRSIDSFSLIVLEDYAQSLDEEGRRLLNIIRGEAQRMDQLIHDLLDFARTSRQPFRADQCDLSGLAHEVYESIPASERAHLRQFKIGELPTVEGDYVMLRQVFFNLISNAIKFTRHTPDAMVEIGGFVEGDHAVYFIKDNGVGFDPRYEQKLFQVFQRLHSEEEFEGTGVGLAIVHRIISRHAGSIQAKGEPGKGATFTFKLPLRQTVKK